VAAMHATSESGTEDTAQGANSGWIAGFLVILLVMAVGAAFWFMHHP